MHAMRRVTGIALVCAMAVVWVSAQSRTVWDGVYTDEQAERGRATFDTVCARCHTFDPQATGNGALAGDGFWTAFSQKNVADLLTYVKTSMPNGNGGSLPAKTYNDLVALILKSNGFPAGAAEVTPESVVGVAIVPKDGSTALPANALARVVGCLAKSGSDWVLTHATAPERTDRSGPGSSDATRPLGTRAIALKFVLTPLDAFAGKRMSVSGMLIGADGADGINVTTVNPVAESCP